MPRRGSGGEPK
jgi:hypothetical protein